jgi:hypothetical protein
LRVDRAFVWRGGHAEPVCHRLRLESLRRSLAMLQTNQLALTRDQGLELATRLIEARERLRRLPQPTEDHLTDSL